MQQSISKERLAALLAKARQNKLDSQPKSDPIPAVKEQNSIQPIASNRYGEQITYNENQQKFIALAASGKNVVLCGAAGTGKTTSVQGAMNALIQNGSAGILFSEGHKYLPPMGVPGIVVCAFTRRAVANIRRNMPSNMQGNCITIHKLLEYEPIFYSVIDETTGNEKNTMRFEPTRNRIRPLPPSIHTIVIEEASMVSVELFEQIQNACQHPVQFIFLGDIQQLPPVFGSAILGFKMLEYLVIELTEVYRQALESPIIRLAHRILSGTGIPAEEFAEWETPNQLKLHAWKKKISADAALSTSAAFLTKAMDTGALDIEQDVILIPFNKSFGTDELNKCLAQHIATKQQKIVHQVIAGFERVHLSVGDKVLYDKEDAIILSIEKNPAYTGTKPKEASQFLDYWGHLSQSTPKSGDDAEEMEEDEFDLILANAAAMSTTDDERVRQASHIITVKMLDTEREVKLNTAAEVNTLILAYAITVHKSQGSEWRKVFLLLHQSHATMIQRELLYTAVTRAREMLYVICEPESFVNGIRSQRIKGNSLEEKAQYFKGKLDQQKEIRYD